MLDTEVWLEQAQRAQLKPGQRRRFDHNCGAPGSVLVTASVNGLSAWCFRCGESCVINKELSLAEKAELVRERKKGYESFRESKLPHDFTLEVPAAGLNWLSAGGIRLGELRKLGIGYSKSMQRLIIPVYGTDGTLAFTQARAIQDGASPKYLNSGGSAAANTLFQTAPLRGLVVVTEDILSAVRCGRYYPSAALCGVSLSDYKSLALLKADTILCFLDPDPAGQKGMRKFIKRMSVLHSDIRKVQAHADPKNLSNKELYETIQGVLT